MFNKRARLYGLLELQQVYTEHRISDRARGMQTKPYLGPFSDRNIVPGDLHESWKGI